MFMRLSFYYNMVFNNAFTLFQFIYKSFRFQKRKALFIAFQLLTAVAFFGIKFIQPIEHTAAVDFHCNDGASALRYCPTNGKLDKCAVAEIANGTSNGPDSELVHCSVSYSFQHI